MLASVFGEPALVEDCFAGCESQHQQTAFAKKKRHDVVFFVKPAPRASADPRLSVGLAQRGDEVLSPIAHAQT
jgi:hypothetical protein